MSSEQRNNRGETLEEYLTSRIVAGPNCCWVWKGAAPGKYGIAEFCNKSDSAHRTSFRCFNGDIPDGQIVRHKCDNTRCINPDHLILGTKKDNRKDFMERHPRSKELCLEASRVGSLGVKKFWNSMSPEEKEKFCKQRNKQQMAKNPNWAPRKGKKNSMHQRVSVSFLNLLKRTIYWGA